MKKQTKSANPLEDFMTSLNKTLDKAARDPAAYMESIAPPTVGNPITLGPRVIGADEWSKKLVDRATAGGDAWLNHSLRPKKVPSVAALAANDKRVSKLQDSITAKSWEGAMARVDEDLRLTVIGNVGARGFADGIAAHKPKVDKVVGNLQPLVSALATTLDAMPTKSDSDREAKMIAAKRGMQLIGKKRRGIA